MKTGIQQVQTKLGVFRLAWERGRLLRVAVPGQRLPGPRVSGDACLARMLQRYAEGERVDPAAARVELALEVLTVFQRRVLSALRRVKRGSTLSYGALAAQAGCARGARAVGGVMRRNPWPVIVPCHRVLASGGTLGGFTSPRGTAFKAELLRLEGVVVRGGADC